MPTTVTKEEIETFQKDGVVCLRGKFSRHWLDKIQKGLRKVYNSPSQYCDKLCHDDAPSMFYFQDLCNMKRIDEFADFVFKSPTSTIVKQLMKSKKVSFYCDFSFLEDPGQRKAIPWHQDQPYYPIDGWQFCSVWMPMYPVSKKSCLRFIKGSHLWGDWYYPKAFINDSSSWESLLQNGNSHCYGNSKTAEFTEELSWDLEPGDCLVVHVKTAHGCPSHVDRKPSEIFFTRWLGDDAFIQPRSWELASPAFNLPEHCRQGESISCYPDLFPVVTT